MEVFNIVQRISSNAGREETALPLCMRVLYSNPEPGKLDNFKFKGLFPYQFRRFLQFPTGHNCRALESIPRSYKPLSRRPKIVFSLRDPSFILP